MPAAGPIPDVIESPSGAVYGVLRHLASGGTAEILLARTMAPAVADHGYVVLKWARPDPSLATSLAEEGRIAARLAHPNIVRVVEVLATADSECLVLECLHGEDLRALLAELRRTGQRMPYGIAVYIAAVIADALDFAYECPDERGVALRVIHRDVSPSNIVVTYAGVPTLLDFGIARAADSPHQTGLGVVKGSLAYMSPEQCTQGTLDRRSDVFSLAVVLYELTTLARPFGPDDLDPLDLMDRIVSGTREPPAAHVADYPDDLAQLLDHALSSARELRPATAGQLASALRGLAARRGWHVRADDVSAYLRQIFGPRTAPWLEDPPTRVAGWEPSPPAAWDGNATVMAPPPPDLLARARAAASAGAPPGDPDEDADTIVDAMPPAPARADTDADADADADR